MPKYAPLIKLSNCQKLGANVVLHGSPTLADGLAIPQVGANAFEIAHELVDLAVTVTEEQIAIAILRLVESENALCSCFAAATLIQTS